VYKGGGGNKNQHNRMNNLSRSISIAHGNLVHICTH
jgi:hypothetical protein